jgi:hypothetical protein
MSEARINTIDEFEEDYARGIGHKFPPRGGRKASLGNTD